MYTLTRARLSAALIALALAATSSPSNAIGHSATRPGKAGATILRVAPTGNDSSGCGSEASPCRTLAFAIRQAVAEDEIRAAAGTYTGAGADPACALLFTAVLCVADKPLTIRGGFSTTNWTSSDPVANPTIIDGQNRYRGVNIVNTNRLVMEGFVIQNGLAEAEAGDANAFGGGMTVIQSAVTLRDMTFQNNVALGQDSEQEGVGGAAAGSALAIRSAPADATSLIERVVFRDNTSIGGAGAERGGYAFGSVFIFQSKVEIQAATFTGNLAQAGHGDVGSAADGSRADALGGAVAIEGNGEVSLIDVLANDNVVIGGNGAQFGGGGFGGAVYVEDSSLTITDSRFQSNLARGGDGSTEGGFAGGGGILVFNSEAKIERVQVIANRALSGSAADGTAGPVGGGGVYLWRARPDAPATNHVINAIIADNAVESGGGQNVGGGGGGIQIQGLTAEVTHATLAGNRLGAGLIAGGALVVVEAPGVSTTTVNLNYSIVADHTTEPTGAAIVVLPDNALNLTGGLFAGNTADTNSDPSQLPAGAINGLETIIRADSAGFVSAGPPQYDYRITAQSPAVDQAIGSTTPDDFEGRPRPSGAAPDLGAHEFGAPAPPEPELPKPRAFLPIALGE